MDNRMSAKGGSASGGKICVLNNLYKPFNRGGAERVAETIVQGLIKAGHEVFVITTKPRKQLPITPEATFGASNYQLPSSTKASEDKPIYYLNSCYYNLNKLPKFMRLLWHIWDMFNFVSYFKIKKILKNETCDAVISNNLMGLGYLTARAIKKLKIKQLQIVHDIQLIHPSGIMYYGEEKKVNHYFSRNYAGLTSWLVDSPEVVIFPSRWLMEIHLEKIFFIKSKRIILPNPVSYPVSAAGRREKESGGDESIKFLYLGQIEKHKGVFLLIQAFKKLKLKFPQSELLIAGHGSQLEAIKLKIGDDSQIKVLGKIEENSISSLMATADFLVLPTLCYENCPTVILEAFAAGLPVIAADIGGISELLSKNAGILFKPADLEDLVNKMEWGVEHKNNLSEMIRAGQEKAALCQADNYIKELERLLIV